MSQVSLVIGWGSSRSQALPAKRPSWTCGDSGNDSFYAQDGVNDIIDGGSGTSDNLVTRDGGDNFTNIEIYV